LSLGKKDIVKNINTKAHLPKYLGNQFVNHFLNIIKSAKEDRIKISNFGVFYSHVSPVRIGRNPTNKESFQIPKRVTLKFKASPKIRKIFN
jgi:nucleoid DNA-binding protein